MSLDPQIQQLAQQLIQAHSRGLRGHQICADCAFCGGRILNRLLAGVPQILEADSVGITIAAQWVCGERCAGRLLDRVEAAEAEQAAAAAAKRDARNDARRARRAAETDAELAEQERMRDALRAAERVAC